MRLGAALFALCLSALAASRPVAAARADAPDPCAPMPLTYRAALSRATAETPDGVTIASLNMAGQPRIEEALAGWVRRRGSEVVLLQEVGGHGVDGAGFVASLSERLGYDFAYAPADRVGDDVTQGLAIVSRGRMDRVEILPLEHHQLRFRSRCRIALAASVETDAGRVRVVNVHLDTRINSKDRVAQLAPILDSLSGEESPQIIGGDFNTMDVGWFHSMWPFPYFQHQVAAVRTRLAEHEFHTPLAGGRATFKLLGLPIKLDWLYLKQLEAVDWSVDEVPLSDHRGVWARVKK